MLTKEDLQLLSDMFDKKLDEKLKPIQQDIEQMKEDIAIIKEDTAAALYSSSELVRWVDTNFRHKYPFPIDRDIG